MVLQVAAPDVVPSPVQLLDEDGSERASAACYKDLCHWSSFPLNAALEFGAALNLVEKYFITSYGG